MAWITAGAASGAVPVLDHLLPSPDHLSFSQVTNLAPEITRSEYGCPRKWGYQRLLGLPFVSGGMLIVGRCVDKGVSAYLAARMAGWDYETAWVGAATIAGWEFDEENPGEQYRRVVAEALEMALEHVRDLVPADVQRRHEFTVRSLDGRRIRSLLGFSDWIDQDGTIVDLKCVGSPASQNVDKDDWIHEKRFQLSTYYTSRLAEERHGIPQPAPVVPRGRLVVVYHNSELKKPQLRVRNFNLEDEDIQWVLRGVRLADQRSHLRILPAHPGKACVMCDHRDRCRDDERERAMPFTALTGVPEAM